MRSEVNPDTTVDIQSTNHKDDSAVAGAVVLLEIREPLSGTVISPLVHVHEAMVDTMRMTMTVVGMT